MAEYLHFLTQTITATTEGVTEYVGFYADEEYVREEITGYSDADWIAVDGVDDSTGEVEYTIETNTGRTRIGRIYIKTNILYPGESDYTVVTDYATVYQAGAIGGTGSITITNSDATIQANGGSVVVSFISSNIESGSISINPDTNWGGDLVISDVTATGFTVSAIGNEGSTRQARIQVSGKMTDSDEYAYAWVSITQMDKNDIGHFFFDPATILVDYDADDWETIEFECPHISSVTQNAESSEFYWLSAGTVSITYDDEEEIGYGELTYKTDANPYIYGRGAYISLTGRSLVDGSEIVGRVYFEQAANEDGTEQLGFIYPDKQQIIEETPDEVCLPAFNMSYVNINRNYLQCFGNGNFKSGPSFVGDKASIIFCLNPATSTTEWTESTIQVIGRDSISGNPVSIMLSIMQPPFVEQIEFPIWRDTYVNIQDNRDYVDYIIVDSEDKTIFSGRAYTLGGTVSVKLNEIMKDLLYPYLNVTTYNVLQDRGAYANAIMKIKTSEDNYQAYKRIRCFNDWSYDDGVSSSYFISYPIRNEVDSRQLLLCSLLDYDGELLSVDLDVYKKNGTTLYEYYDLNNKIGTIVKQVYDTNKVELFFGGGPDYFEYLVIDSCKRYCLYYANASGGWDSFLFENTSKEQDNFNRQNYSRNIDNKSHNHGKVLYSNKITKKWTLKTSYLNDRQSLIFAKHLVGSVCAYLHDLEEDKIYPVNIDSKNVDYQTFVRNGRKFNRYDISVELAQERYRR